MNIGGRQKRRRAPALDIGERRVGRVEPKHGPVTHPDIASNGEIPPRGAFHGALHLGAYVNPRNQVGQHPSADQRSRQEPAANQ